MTARDLYDHDFFQWTLCNAALLRAGQFEQADIEHLAEEIEAWGEREQHALESRLSILLMHLLKWQAQPGRRGSSWEATIEVQRLRVSKLLTRMPSLRSHLQQLIAEAYQEARLRAAVQTGLPKAAFPAECPFSPGQILDQTFYPG